MFFIQKKHMTYMEIDEKGGEEAKFTVKLSIVHTLLCI